MNSVALQPVEAAVVQRKLISTQKNTIKECVTEALEKYLSDLDGHEGGDLYQLVLSEVEKPLLDTVLRHTQGNQTRAADLLGINRGTLRKKLKEYGLA